MGKEALTSLSLEVALLRERLEEAGHLDLPAEGLSMWPLYRPGQRVIIHACAPEDLRVGDVVLFAGRERLVLHRVIACRPGMVLTKGDARVDTDRWVQHDQVIGRAKPTVFGSWMVSLGPVLGRPLGFLARRLH